MRTRDFHQLFLSVTITSRLVKTGSYDIANALHQIVMLEIFHTSTDSIKYKYQGSVHLLMIENWDGVQINDYILTVK